LRQAKGAVPKRLANVEQARDVLLRDKLQQRQIAQEEAEARAPSSNAGSTSRAEPGNDEKDEHEEELSARAR
jgi:hypothetical protein